LDHHQICSSEFLMTYSIFLKSKRVRFNLQADWFQIDALLNSVGGMFEKLAANNGLNFSLMTTSSLLSWMDLDSLRLNAVMFTATGGIKIETNFLPQDSEQGLLPVRFLDSGIGEPEELEARLFKPFFQAHSSISRGFGGTGLGTNDPRLRPKWGGVER